MVCNIFYNSKTAKTDSNVTNIVNIYGCNDVYINALFLLLLIFRSFIRINIGTGWIFNFIFFQFAKKQRRRVRKPINNKKGLINKKNLKQHV